ncbi:MAG: hypothetical protein E7Z91_01195 [Cyanobacteria bacterium SIG30]|nr:hypothetical protein [Cyanobacteria bacterium SIG30]
MNNLNVKRKTEENHDVCLDLSTLNFVEAIKIAVDVSTNCFLKNDNSKIFIQLKDDTTRTMLLPFKLKNTILEIKDNKNEKCYKRNYR